jgi:hypothetical protein
MRMRLSTVFCSRNDADVFTGDEFWLQRRVMTILMIMALQQLVALLRRIN